MQLRALLLLLFIPVISACERSFDIPIPEEAKKPVLNLLMNKDSIMIARVALSARMDETTDGNGIKDAVVSLYENGSFKETLSAYTRSGYTFYRSRTLPRAGAVYRVAASVPGYKEVSGSDQIPDTVATGEMKMIVTKVNQWQQRVTINVQLHDNPDIQNYYRIRLYQVTKWVNASGDTGRQKLQQYFETGEAAVPILEDDFHSDFFTTDALFNGRSPVFTLKADVYTDFSSMVVEISSLTYHSYNYLNSAYLAAEKNDDGLSEEVIVYNNIVNGFGIVGGAAQREYELVR